MGRYLIVEPEERSLQLIQESLLLLDKEAVLEIFADLQGLKNHVGQLPEDEQAEYWKFDLYILDYSLYPYPQWSEQLQFIHSNNSKKAAVLLTGYESSFTALKYLRTLDICNFLSKPFDALLLKESLNIARNLRKKVTPIEIKSQTTSASVAFLKDVELQSISELGFVTLSDSEIKRGSTAKYFSSLFAHGKKRSVWAECLLSIPHPQKPGTFVNKFQFFGADQLFLNILRRYIQDHKANHTSSALWSFAPSPQSKPVKMAIVALDTLENQNFIQDLHNRFSNLTAEIVKIDPLNKPSPAYDHDIVLNYSDLSFDKFGEYFQEDSIHLWMGPTIADEESLKGLAEIYHDVFYTPYDRSYFYKKLKIHFPNLEEVTPTVLVNVTTREKMKVANKVRISDPCELFVNLFYPRELPLHEFREIVFLSDDESQSIELPAVCHYVEKSKSNDSGASPSYFHQFVFFGMKDHLLKEIRLWLLRNYINENQKDSE